jgi:hypothetical protein
MKTRTWIGEDGEPSLFPIDLWNHYYTQGPKTNNNIEGYHAKLNRYINRNFLFYMLYRFLVIIINILK